MKYKYIEERYSRYFKFGKHEAGVVDVATIDNNCICTVSEHEADKLISDRDELIDMIFKLCNALESENSDAFNLIWYGNNNG